MSTITENINKILQVKNDLNEVLRENGIEGGRVFEDYPEKFRELFRVMQSYTEEAVDVYTGPGTAETFVPDPVITFFENTISITCPMKNATIYYSIKSESGKYDHGFIPYDVSIKIRENVYVEAFARYNGIDSNNTVSMNCEFVKGNIPDTPVITRDGTTVTITCTGNYTSIWWSTVDGNYVQYTGPVNNVSRTNDVWAYSTYNDFASDKVFDAAPEQIIVPEVPVLDTSVTNKITITCETSGATIWYMTRSEGIWREYTGQITITESDYYRAMATLNGIQGMNSEWVYAEHYENPANPVITTSNNTVTITTSTAAATIYYRKSGETEWTEYTGPFVIDETTQGVYEAYAVKHGLESDVVSATCTYVAPYVGSVGTCIITKAPYSNLIYITCTRPDATIYYKVSPTQISMDGFDINDLSNYDGIYNGPFYITEDSWIYAHAVRPPYSADDITEQYYEYYNEDNPPVIGDKLEAPTISYENNVVYISSNVTGATIYYKTGDDDAYRTYNGNGIPISATTTFMAYVAKEGYQQSDVTSVECIYAAPVIERPANPVIDITNNIITLTCSTPGAVIYYKIAYGDFSTAEFLAFITSPDGYSTYVAPIAVGQNCTVAAYSYKNEVSSEVVNKIYRYLRPININWLTLDIIIGGLIGIESLTPSTVRPSEFAPLLFYYSINGGDWKLGRNCNNLSSARFRVANGDKVRFRTYFFNDGTTYAEKGKDNWYKFVAASGVKFNVSGNPMSLVNYEEAYDTLEYRFNYLFLDCKAVVSTENLDLPFDTLCYKCYSNMFTGCTNLTTAPSLPATNLAEECYGSMFNRCTSLITPPELNATTLVRYCYSDMFDGCTSLEFAPELNATRLVYSCYSNMFANCSKLRYVKCLAETFSSSQDTFNWMYKTVATIDNIFVKAAGVNWVRGANGIQTNWTIQEV